MKDEWNNCCPQPGVIVGFNDMYIDFFSKPDMFSNVFTDSLFYNLRRVLDLKGLGKGDLSLAEGQIINCFHLPLDVNYSICS
jgi:hypothetical protein